MAFASMLRPKRPIASSPTRALRKRISPGKRTVEPPPGVHGLASQESAAALPSLQILQTKLEVGKPHDKFEQEADRVADKVMRMPESTVAPEGSSGHGLRRTLFSGSAGAQFDLASQEVHRQLAEEEIEEEEAEAVRRQPEDEEPEDTVLTKRASGSPPAVTPDLQSHTGGLRHGGQSLPQSVRSFFEPRFGLDFRGVRIHTDASSASLSHSLDARAFAVGRHVAFGRGQFAPSSQAGRWLIAHELAHVAQQSNVDQLTSASRGALEAEAESAAHAVMAGQSFRPRHGAVPSQRLAVPVATGPGRIEIPSPDRVVLTNFDIERATLKPEWVGAIALVANMLNLDPSREAEIIGHTDDTGPSDFNLDLSLDRADTMQQELEGRVLEPAVASPLTVGLGEAVPLDTNATAPGRERNRRVEIRIVDRPLPDIDHIELLNSAASQTFVIPAVAPVPGSDHGVTVAREVAPDARVRATLNPPLAAGDRRIELITWTGAAQDPANPIEADVTRAMGQNAAIARISSRPPPPLRSSSAQFTVWSVDATIASAVPNAQVVPSGAANRRLTMPGLTFNVTVIPLTLFSTADAPDMRGPAPAPTPVPGAGTVHFLSGNDLSGGVNSRWDVTRRIRTRFIFPAGVTAATLGAAVPSLVGLPVPAFPANRLIGSDDSTTTDPEDNDPYVDGLMSGFDRVRVHIRNAAGVMGDVFVARIHFQEFVRLDLGGAWRQTSDDHPWKLHYRIRKFVIPAVGLNRWFNAGSFGALDNAGF